MLTASPPVCLLFAGAIAIAIAVAFAAATAVSCLPAGCRVDVSSSYPLDSASASQRATPAYRGPVASCTLVPLLPFASRLPAGCRVACCRVLAATAALPLPPVGVATPPTASAIVTIVMATAVVVVVVLAAAVLVVVVFVVVVAI